MKAMVLRLCVMAPNRIVWNSEVWEIVLSTNSGQIGILPNHAPLLAALDMGVSKIRTDGQWSAMASMGGFAMIDNNRVTILVNEAERASEIDPDEAQRGFQKAQAELAEAEGRRRIIEANLTFKRAKARLEASTTV
nr:ATP synthase CF1 epsilon subunit [Adiantum reniforme var. sinense]UNZ94067.1 ATP synthase CF1 epsilon subunit [Adiantum reniforme var. sinense]